MRTHTARELKTALEQEEDLHLVHVLPREEYERKHIPGSDNVPVQEEDFSRRVEELVGGKEARVVVYCASAECTASPEAAKALEDAGFRDVTDFAGGVEEWETAGFPLEGKAVRS